MNNKYTIKLCMGLIIRRCKYVNVKIKRADLKLFGT